MTCDGCLTRICSSCALCMQFVTSLQNPFFNKDFIANDSGDRDTLPPPTAATCDTSNTEHSTLSRLPESPPTLCSSGKVQAGGGGLLSAYWTNSFASHWKQILRILYRTQCPSLHALESPTSPASSSAPPKSSVVIFDVPASSSRLLTVFMLVRLHASLNPCHFYQQTSGRNRQTELALATDLQFLNSTDQQLYNGQLEQFKQVDIIADISTSELRQNGYSIRENDNDNRHDFEGVDCGAPKRVCLS